jgi:hypothetical protein
VTDLRVVDGATEGDEGTEPSPHSRRNGDSFQRLEAAQKTPAAVVDDDGKVLRKLAGASKLAGLAKGTRITRVVERGEGAHAEYDIYLENGACASVTEAQLSDPRVMERRFRKASKRPMPWIGPKEWKPAADAIANEAQPDNTTGSEAEETREWLAHFLNELTVIDLDNPEALFYAIAAQRTFRGSDDRVYVRPPELLHHVVVVLKQRSTPTDVRRRLSRLGFTKPRNAEGKLTARHGDQVATHRYLASPPRFEVD